VTTYGPTSHIAWFHGLDAIGLQATRRTAGGQTRHATVTLSPERLIEAADAIRDAVREVDPTARNNALAGALHALNKRWEQEDRDARRAAKGSA
jgi:ABC-type Zn uptake system ZnuABC Zn-binding protein ZnuA